MKSVENGRNWFKITKLKDYLYVIEEMLYKIDPRFYTNNINLYLIIGSHSALLIDTGCGLFPLRPIIKDIIANKKLKVVNTHSHFDHIGGNSEFDKVYIHEKELNEISIPTNVSFLKDTPEEITKLFERRNYTIQPCNDIQPLKSDEIIDLGEISVRIIHTPGHSPGSISLLTNKNELFTGDTAHYGTMYFSKEEIPTLLSSISKLLELYQISESVEIYPSHEDYGVNKKLLIDLFESIPKIDKLWKTKRWDNFLEGWVIYDVNFAYVVF